MFRGSILQISFQHRNLCILLPASPRFCSGKISCDQKVLTEEENIIRSRGRVRDGRTQAPHEEMDLKDWPENIDLAES